MKARTLIAVAVMAFAMVASPAYAQSRKDKKAAKKAQWEMEQQQQREEAELKHKLKMDSIANANKIAAENAAKAEADRRQRQQDSIVAAKKKAEKEALQEVEVNEPCTEYESTADLIRARGIGEDFEQQMSVDAARSAALQELGSQLSTKIQALVLNYSKSVRKNLKRQSVRRIEGLVQTSVDEQTGYRIACRKTFTYEEKGERIFKTYMVVELGEDTLLRPVFDGLQKDDELKLDSDYQSFKKDFDEHFKNKSQEALQKIIDEEQE